MFTENGMKAQESDLLLHGAVKKIHQAMTQTMEPSQIKKWIKGLPWWRSG